MKTKMEYKQWRKHFIQRNIRITGIIAVLFLTCFFTSCNSNDAQTNKLKSDTDKTQIYYINMSGTKLVGVDYEAKASTQEELVKEYLKELSKDPSDYELKKSKPSKVKVTDFDFNEDGRLSLYFNTNYYDLSGITEVLCRAAIVKTLCQIDGVESIEFYVDGQPLMGANNNPVGLMTAKDFIDDTSAEDVFVTVYFANKKGNALVGSNLKITYDGNFSIEQLILERLIAGPIEKNMQKTIPDGTKLIQVSTKDGICYVDFNEKFLDKVSGVKDTVALYSVVNSLVELSTINKVQFTINGEVQKYYQDDIAFDGFFERNLELVEGSK